MFSRSLLLSVSTLLGLAVASDATANLEKKATQPNIVFILTDDQDYQMNSLDYMQGVQNHLVCVPLPILRAFVNFVSRFNKVLCTKGIIVLWRFAVLLE